MSTNSSSCSSDSLLHPNLCSNNTLDVNNYCLFSGPSSFIITTFFFTNILLLLPICIFIVYHGLQQWRQKHSTSSAPTMSHSDSFTYHMVTMELIHVFGCVLCCCGIYSDHLHIFKIGISVYAFNWYGEMFFHVLTCVERYLAVVHPVTYLSLRQERGIRIRNISIGCVWLLCFVGFGLQMMGIPVIIVDLCILIMGLPVVVFCSLSVLCVLIRPGPGEQGKGKARIDQSKQRAFYTIVVILEAQLMRFAWNLVWFVLSLFGRGGDCVMIAAGTWLNLPSSLVLPLLFLYRAGKLVCWKKNTQCAPIQ